MKDSMKQCTLEAPEEASKGVRRMVEWVPSKLAYVGNLILCKREVWSIIHVGAEDDNHRSSHDCKT